MTAGKTIERIAAPIRANALLGALMAALSLYVWRVQDLFPVLATIKLLPIVSIAVPVLILLDRRAQRQLAFVIKRPLARLLLLIAVMGALSVPTSLWPGMSFDFLTKNLLPAIVLSLAVMGAISSVIDVRRFVWIQVVGATIYSEVILTRFDIGPNGRLGNLVFYDANDLGMLLVCTVPFIVFLLRHTRSAILRALVLGSLVLCLLTIVKTGSRGAFLALVAVSLYLLFRFSTVNVSTRVITVGVVAAALIAGAGDSYWKAMGTLLKPTEDYNWVGGESGGRMEVWSRGIGYMTSRPLTGVGLGAFPMAEGTISPLAAKQSYGRGIKWSAAHNSFVQIGAELGVPGLLLFGSILWMTFRMAGRLARDARARAPAEPSTAGLASAHAAAVVGFAVGGFFLSQAYAPYLYFVVGSVVGLDTVVRIRWRMTPPNIGAMAQARPMPRRARGVTRAVAMQRAR
ncbi:MAG TPA: O-antigen ligase family protein [Gemmatimonadaceae bacterium]|jgi:O-antigen ligase|nr:O-antigen ligase family protein [Gemmatimonadaceae bacterium]